MWLIKLLISPIKKKDFLPKKDQIWPKIGIFGQFGPGHAGLFNDLLPVVGSVGGCGARAVSRKTPIYFIVVVVVVVVVVVGLRPPAPPPDW